MWYFVVGFITGTILGSFAKALADRSLRNESFKGRSYCLFCKYKLRWYDLFPIISYLLLKGRCRKCKKKIPLEYLLVEVLMGTLIGFLFFESFKNLQFSIYNFQSIFNLQFPIIFVELLFKIFFITILITVTLTDIKEMLIPDRIIIPSIIIAFILGALLVVYRIWYLYYGLLNHPLGQYLLPPHSDYFQRHAYYAFEPFFYSILMGLALGGFFLLLIIITRGKGMGGGDVKLGAFMGLVLGFPNTLIAGVLAFVIGAAFSVVLIFLGKKSLKQTIPFGPFLVLGSLIALFWGPKIIDWYLHLSF